ncbi:phytanoyl-CoA dioxygenase family protein [Mobilicoccus massiliensis]|uniref:phytanoyl-CoA dioxygenase family protein n=1 Tax=Mobilicoccus massiliensis TaxID=1522310 RepID=UPI00058AC6E8|nr:phytanoyl-CoA dioxygenase family protein [Mobilicoccus massiliensis]
MTLTTRHPHRLSRRDCRLDDLVEMLRATTDPADVPHADRVEQGVPVYDAAAIPAASGSEADERARAEYAAEIASVLADGAGIVVFTGAVDPAVIDPVSAAFERIIAEEKASGTAAGDHFARPGANDRMWNALEKLAVTDPEAFADYYAFDALALAAGAWLGPGYQVTSQVNIVNPGGAGQTVHRDYHLGFQSPDVSERFPRHVHLFSGQLTLQGAVAHVDMPLESGPTLYLPHSQKYELGYLAYWLPEFQEYFQANHVQLPLAKGDAVFFNPALMHAAGTNVSSDVRRTANLLQVSSAFGRAMESVDRRRVVEAVYPALLDRAESGTPRDKLVNVVAASAEGYAFPTNLDRDQPIDGMSPSTQADLVLDALDRRVAVDDLARTLAELDERHRTH